MTSAHDDWRGGQNSRAADSAQCLLVVGGYAHNAAVLDEMVDKVKDRIEMSPSMVDFFEVRFVDMGMRPEPSADVTPGVARLALEFTSRPGDAARNFSALVVIDRRASVIDRVFRACRANPVMSRLNVRYLGLASKEDREPATAQSPAPSGDGMRITVSPNDHLSNEQIVGNILRQAEFLFHDFGSGGERGVTGTSLNEIGSVAEPTLRRVIAAAAGEEAALRARDAETWRQAELRTQAEIQRQQAEIRQRQAEERQQAEEQKQAEKRRQAEIQQQAEERRRAEELGQSATRRQAEATEDQDAIGGKASSRSPDAPDQPSDVEQGDGGQRRAGTPAMPQDQQSPTVDPQATRNTGAFPAAVLNSGARLLGVGVAGFRRVLPPPRNTDGGLDSTDAAEMLHECGVLLRRREYKAAKVHMSSLRSYADGEISAEDQRRYRDIAIKDELLRPDLPVGTLDGQFYDMLLRLAFGQPLDYPRYCDIERCLAVYGEHGALPRRRAVLEAIDRIGTSDIRVLALTRHDLGPERLKKWFRERDVDLHGLVTALAAGEWAAPQHADAAFDVAHLYLGSLRRHDDRRAVVTAMRDNGYLAAALYERYRGLVASQVAELTLFLMAAYPHGLDRDAIAEVFDASVPTPALARAALRTLSHPYDAQSVIRAFARKLGYQECDAAQESKLLEYLTTS